jgi:2-keto-4-pentenoate hydratase/2-oxohepta-3-ene-1,7-dioic acid hydratase in catechol pathway
VRLAVYEEHGRRVLYAREGERFASLGEADLVDLLRRGEAEQRVAEAAARLAPGGPPDGARLLSPLSRPGKQVFVGVNYRDHVDELPPPWKMTEKPFLFSKLQTAIIGPGEPIRLPGSSSHVDYEVELLVVMGRTARALRPQEALDHVFGYTIVNDVTERALQATDNQLTWSKGMDTFCPIGPEVVLTDEIPDPGELAIWTTVNGEERQRSRTDNMIFSIPQLLADITATITLEPGDTVSTGTPAGVGYVQSPPRFLQPGDVVTVGIERIGELTNPVVR